MAKNPKTRRRLTGFELVLGEVAFVDFSSSKFEAFVLLFTPKELRPIAQGCERCELPWVAGRTKACTPTGFRHLEFSKAATPAGNAVNHFYAASARYCLSMSLCLRLAVTMTGLPAEGLSLLPGR